MRLTVRQWLTPSTSEEDEAMGLYSALRATRMMANPPKLERTMAQGAALALAVPFVWLLLGLYANTFEYLGAGWLNDLPIQTPVAAVGLIVGTYAAVVYAQSVPKHDFSMAEKLLGGKWKIMLYKPSAIGATTFFVAALALMLATITATAPDIIVLIGMAGAAFSLGSAAQCSMTMLALRAHEAEKLLERE